MKFYVQQEDGGSEIPHEDAAKVNFAMWGVLDDINRKIGELTLAQHSTNEKLNSFVNCNRGHHEAAPSTSNEQPRLSNFDIKSPIMMPHEVEEALPYRI